MKHTALVFVDDFGHPKETILPVIEKVFDCSKWQVCVMDSVESILSVMNPPDLIVTFKLGISGIVEDRPSWYENNPFTYQWIKWVKECGMGLLVVHSGLCFIPKDHPVVTAGVYGSFAGHPAMGPLKVEILKETNHPIIEGVEDFEELVDEHFQIEGLDEGKTTVFARSTSELGGVQPAGWAHDCGKGRIAVLCPGHTTAKGNNLMSNGMLRMIRNAIAFCGENN